MIRELIGQEGGYTVRESFYPVTIHQCTIQFLGSRGSRAFIGPSMVRALESEIIYTKIEEVILDLYHASCELIDRGRGVLLVAGYLVKVATDDPVSVVEKQSSLDF